MCGICGIVALDDPLPSGLKYAIGPMTDTLAHRGPDGAGCYVNDHVALGHRRLAIIDRDGGVQPMSNEAGTVWVVFNGEIYNHRELRRQLVAKGHRFASACDTEVIVHAYEEYGVDCVARFEGMFAFALYDVVSHTLFAARDRVGKKPFFYSQLCGTIHFASEVKALAASPVWNDAWDPASLESYLSLGYVIAPHTIYRHVKKLEAGHWLRVRVGYVETRKYWDVELFDDMALPEPVLLDELEELLRQAVADRLESEVPLGAFLSGGIDSSLVASLMSQVMPAAPKTVTVGFREKDCNEIETAFATARALGTQHHAHVIDPDVADELDRIVSAFDEPFADSSAVPTYYVANAARQEVTVALTGDGGDEAFSGYQLRYVPILLEARLRTIVRGASGRAVARWLGRHWPRGPNLPRALRLGAILENLGRDAACAYYADLCFLKPWITRELLGLRDPLRFDDSAVCEQVTNAYRRCPSTSALQRAQYADLKIYLANDVLVKVDRMSMLNGLEVRCPLLDRRVIEFAFRIPAEQKMPWFRAKHLLRALASRRLSAEVANRPKRGFDAPVDRWITGKFGPQLASDLFASTAEVRGVLDQAQLRVLYDRHQSGAARNSYVLWAAWVLERWLRLRRPAHAQDAARAEQWPALLAPQMLSRPATPAASAAAATSSLPADLASGVHIFRKRS
jgi:asparagine synthase (glutamine-hydrolysing)